MRHLFLIVLIGFLFNHGSAAATNGNLRLLFHAVKPAGDPRSSKWAVAAWVAAPNITAAPTKWFAVIGPRYQTKTWWLESMAGILVLDKEAKPMLDWRASFEKHKPLTYSGNVQWFDVAAGRNSWLYLYARGDYSLRYQLALLGLETENTIRRGPDTWSVGPHIIVPFKTMKLVMIYQLHRYEPKRQWWTRMILSL